MYYDDFDHHGEHLMPARAHHPPARPRWPRLLGAVGLLLLAVLHACT